MEHTTDPITPEPVDAPVSTGHTKKVLGALAASAALGLGIIGFAGASGAQEGDDPSPETVEAPADDSDVDGDPAEGDDVDPTDGDDDADAGDHDAGLDGLIEDCEFVENYDELPEELRAEIDQENDDFAAFLDEQGIAYERITEEGGFPVVVPGDTTPEQDAAIEQWFVDRYGEFDMDLDDLTSDMDDFDLGDLTDEERAELEQEAKDFAAFLDEQGIAYETDELGFPMIDGELTDEQWVAIDDWFMNRYGDDVLDFDVDDTDLDDTGFDDTDLSDDDVDEADEAAAA